MRKSIRITIVYVALFFHTAFAFWIQKVSPPIPEENRIPLIIVFILGILVIRSFDKHFEKHFEPKKNKLMKKENLNYEMRLFKGNKKVDEFEFHGDNLELARDHVTHVLYSDKEYTSAQFKSLTANNWKTISK